MFDEALGPDQAIVRVHAELDFDDQTVSKEIFEEPTKKGGLVREQSTDSSSEGAGTSGGAVATNGAGPVVGQQNRNSTHSSSKVTYELNRTVQNITQSAGNLKRVSVSVLLKQSFAPAELATLQQAVQQAVGIDPQRGDLLSVAVLPAKALTSAQASMAEQAKSLTTEGKDQRQIMLASAVAPWVVTALAALLLAGLAWAFLRPPRAPKPAPVPLQPAVPAAPPAPTSIPMETDLQQLVERYPSSAAQVLRRMMTN
jgi:flagellar M-ring protein FliF